MRLPAMLVLVMVVGPVWAAAPDGNQGYCNSEESNREWESLVQRNAGSDLIQRLYALRFGLCHQVAEGELTVQRAALIFERQRTQVVDQIRAREQVEDALNP